MLTTILTLLSNKKYLLICLSIVYTVFLIGTIVLQRNKINNLNNNIVAIKVEMTLKQTIYEEEISKAKYTIDSQNKSIEQYIIDKDNYEKNIREKEKRLWEVNNQKQIQIAKELDKDNSDSNQLRLVDESLKEYSNEL